MVVMKRKELARSSSTRRSINTNGIPQASGSQPRKIQNHSGAEQGSALEMGASSSTSTPSFGDGSHIQGLESQRSRELIDKLREHGLDKHIELPQVAIMGDTSSGKSSVLSALSGITFPSSDQLTTRCPTQLVLSYGEEFSGFVSLKRYHQPKEGDRAFSAQIFYKEEITHQIEKLTKQLVDEGQSISDDSIVIKVSGPEFPNLTLIDLPGLVQTVETGEDDSIIPRIKALVDRYLSQTRTVILAVVPANVDMHNTGILQAAEIADREGTRTQAIITKLDLVDEGAEKSVVDLLLNKKKKLLLGYHAVKCRGQKELNEGVSIQEGIQRETLFFETNKIWSQRDIPAADKGIGNLRMKLVKLLEEIILRELPHVVQEIDIKLKLCRDKLSRLGDPMDSTGARRLHYSKSVDFYFVRIEAAIKGTYNVPDFFKESPQEEADNRLRAIVRKKEELFHEAVRSRLHKIQYAETEFEDLSVWDTIEVEKMVGGNNQIHRGCIQSKHEQSVDQYSRILTPHHVVLMKEDGSTVKCDKNSTTFFRVRSLDNIRAMISSNRGDELSIFPSQNIFCSIVASYVDSWEDPTMELFEQYYCTLARVSQHAIQSLHCKTLPKNYLEGTVASILEELRELVQQKLLAKLESERRPYTLNHYLHDILIKLRNKSLLDTFRALDNPKGTTVAVSTVLSILERHGVGQESNEYHVALETENAVIAYLKVASKTFIDEIPKLLNDHLLNPFLVLVKERLNVTDDILTQLLADSGRIVQERNQLKEEEKSLMDSKHEVSRMN